MALLGKYVLIGEGVRGSLAKQLIAGSSSTRTATAEIRHRPQGAVGGQAGASQARPGAALVRLAARHEDRRRLLPLPSRGQPGGGRLRRAPQLQESLSLSPFEEFQRFKTHPAIAPVFEGGKRLGYGARAISEGGWQSVPKLAFPGGALIGCSAGFVNVPRIKGSHNAVLSGMLAAEHAAEAIAAGKAQDTLDGYDAAWRGSEIGKDLKKVRNVKPLWSRSAPSAAWRSAASTCGSTALRRLSPFGTMKHGKPDYAALEPASKHKKIEYPKPDGVLTFDRLSSVFLSNTNHEEDQPVHLQLKDPALQKSSELDVYAGPSNRYCPAGVYEWVETDGTPTFVINAQNCVHCKTCDIKDPQGGEPEHQLACPQEVLPQG
jgi:electron-transferring-flavoprotein dehydrogenase